MSGETILYFAYGSNLDIEQMESRCPSSHVKTKGRLRDYRLDFRRYSTGWRGGVADVVKDDGGEVWGIVYELTRADLKQLDAYEGYPDVYTRFTASIDTPSRTLHDVEVYAVVTKQPFTAPATRYMQIIQRAALELGFPQSYRDYLAQVPVRDSNDVP